MWPFRDKAPGGRQVPLRIAALRVSPSHVLFIKTRRRVADDLWLRAVSDVIKGYGQKVIVIEPWIELSTIAIDEQEARALAPGAPSLCFR